MIKPIFSLLIGLPLYGILISFFPMLTGNTYPIPGMMFYLNPIVSVMYIFFDFMIIDFNKNYDFQNIDSDNVIYPIFLVIFNLLFWIPVAILINRYVEKRKTNKKQ
ncbi:hypothetical protein [Nitrosopumilus sp. Nsub]|uniref:hypothetical protein n=1 Tax=Nitrosopumilus sp. Nsub TaxID=1776294 RepID=UPI00082BF4B2|nr:hypothetical protein [Nitrosopumilus sp. Nsub]MBS1268185.1 hypothetical protein [Nitrosopumilus sp.]